MHWALPSLEAAELAAEYTFFGTAQSTAIVRFANTLPFRLFMA